MIDLNDQHPVAAALLRGRAGGGGGWDAVRHRCTRESQGLNPCGDYRKQCLSPPRSHSGGHGGSFHGERTEG